MCGISVYFGKENENAIKFINRANALLRHRGPDGEGKYFDYSIGLGHTRLAIQDLSESGHQPMLSQDGNLVVVFNGEIYNHWELRKKYFSGVKFKSTSDTETIIAMFSKFGINCFQELVGMWALAIWDIQKKELIISRDRYGQKPLYWRKFSDGSIRFASEIKPLLVEGETNKMNYTAIGEYLALGNYGHLGELTFFEGIYNFPTGSYSVLSSKQNIVNPINYWRFPTLPTSEKKYFDTTLQLELRTAIDQAISSQLLSDVKVGATLSGGLDSTIIVGAIAKQFNSKGGLPVFTAQTAGSKWDETKYVKAVEEMWGNSKIHLHWKELKETKLSDCLYKTILIQEEPFGDPSIVAHGQLMDAAKEAGIPVILGGQGADELFFGYGFMTSALIANKLRKLGFGWSFQNMSLMNFSRSNQLRILLSAYLPFLELYMRKKSRKNRRGWLSSKLQERIDDKHIKLSSMGNIEEIWHESIERVNLPHLVHYDDRNGMARSIEGRMPFLDHRIADVLVKIKSESFLANGKNKNLLRETCPDLIPERILQRRDKIGFYTPLFNMIRNEKDWVSKILFDDVTRGLNLFNVDQLKQDFDRLLEFGGNDNNDYLKIWRALSVRIWAEEFKISN